MDSEVNKKSFGKYEILEELGRGGFGIVYKARDSVLGRLVALKVLHPELLVNRAFLDRFRQEARISAQLDHPNLVPIYEFSEIEGKYYIAMGYMPGGSLKELLQKQGKLEPQAAYELLEQVGAALSYAHRKGIIHRDLKPGNILLDENGKARVADMGFAKVMSEGASRSMSASGSLIGTPAYIAPETWRNKPATPQTDIYSLGCILYEMLTGKVLFEGDSPAEVMTRHVVDGPEYAEELPQELRPVLDKALQREPQERFVDVKAFLTGFRFAVEPPQKETVIHPIFVDPEPPITPKANVSDESKPDDKGASVKKIGKSKLAIGIIGVTVVMLLISIFVWVFLSTWVAVLENKANLPNVTATSQPVVTNTKTSLVEQFSTTTPTTQPTPIMIPTQYGIDSISVITNDNADQVTQLERLGKGTLSDIAYSPNGSLIAVASSIGIYLHDGETLEEIALIGEDTFQNSVSWSPDGNSLVSGGRGTITLWDVASAKQLLELQGDTHNVSSVAWSPNGGTLASASTDGSVILWDVASGTKLRMLEGPMEGDRIVAWSPDGQTLASGRSDGTIILWDAESGSLKHTLEGHTSDVSRIAWSPDGQTLASGSYDWTVILWDVQSGSLMRTLGEYGGDYSLVWSPDGQILASVTDAGTIILWDSKSGSQPRTLEGHTGWLRGLAWSPNGETLASATYAGIIMLWDVETGIQIRELEKYSLIDYSVTWLPDSKMLGASTYEDAIILRDHQSGVELRTLKMETRAIRPWVLSPDGKTLASGSYNNEIILWDWEKDNRMRYLGENASDLLCVAWSPDGKTLASGYSDDTIILWDAESGRQLRTLEGHTVWLWSLAWSPDGQTLASGDENGTVILWNTENGSQLCALEEHTAWVHSLAWSPDGHTLASGSYDWTVILWDVQSCIRSRTLEGHSIGTKSVDWSPDGTMLASGSYHGAITLWDAQSGSYLHTLDGHTWHVDSIAWSPDGKTLVSGSSDGTVRVWGIP